ncbi:hypothetical protein BFF78_35865 [Streptomyces fodineus]|uniref:HTH luxR-type domain-containing protein n=1 Tax=Streptomyces fodineus TaxID=1904616 RepID=A0A1D7YK66_9ACTN|nr:hypothetical protein [Streptomyces fodineus]AOR35739.1 hypothetical protein BFF78_35865 [Streptomyces fodineus]
MHRAVRLLLAAIALRCELVIPLAVLSGEESELGAVAEPIGQPDGTMLPLVEEATDVGRAAGFGDRLLFTQPRFWRPVPEPLAGPIRTRPAASPYTPASPNTPASPSAPPRAPWPAGLGEIDRMIATLVGDGLNHSRIATSINRAPQTVSYHLRKMFGTLSALSRSELAGTVGQRPWEAP